MKERHRGWGRERDLLITVCSPQPSLCCCCCYSTCERRREGAAETELLFVSETREEETEEREAFRELWAEHLRPVFWYVPSVTDSSCTPLAAAWATSHSRTDSSHEHRWAPSRTPSITNATQHLDVVSVCGFAALFVRVWECDWIFVYIHMSAYEFMCVKACLSPERQGKRLWVGGSSKFRRELIWFIPYSPSVKPMCCSQKNKVGGVQIISTAKENSMETPQRLFFQPDLTRFWFVACVGREIWRKSAGVYVARLQFSRAYCLCLSCAKEMLHLSQRKHWPCDGKFVAGSKSNSSKHGA